MNKASANKPYWPLPRVIHHGVPAISNSVSAVRLSAGTGPRRNNVHDNKTKTMVEAKFTTIQTSLAVSKLRGASGRNITIEEGSWLSPRLP